MSGTSAEEIKSFEGMNADGVDGEASKDHKIGSMLPGLFDAIKELNHSLSDPNSLSVTVAMPSMLTSFEADIKAPGLHECVNLG